MRFLISSHRGLFIFDDEEGPTGTIQELSSGYYYGIAVYEDYVLVARRVDPWSDKVSPTTFEFWRKDGTCMGVAGLDGNDIIDVHEIAVGPNGLYICNPGRNLLEIYDKDTFDVKQTLSFDTNQIPGGLLINSIFVDGDDFYTLFHNRGEQSFIHHMRHDGDDVIFCQRIYIPSGGAHSVVVHDNFLFYNASESGALHRIDMDEVHSEDWDKKDKMFIRYVQLEEDLHTKGMAILPDKQTIVIGASQKGTLKDRFVSESFLVYIDINELKEKKVYKLMHPNGGNVGNINEIELLD